MGKASVEWFCENPHRQTGVSIRANPSSTLTSGVSVDLPGTVFIATPISLDSGTVDLSSRVVAVDPAEEVCGLVIEMRLIVGGADDRAISQEGEIPATVLVYLDSIQGGIGGECFPSLPAS